MLAMGAEIFIFLKKKLDGSFKSLQLCVHKRKIKKKGGGRRFETCSIGCKKCNNASSF
jgi:hypothetical protein